MTPDDIGIYCESLRELFLQPSKQLFDEQLLNKIKNSLSLIIWKNFFKLLKNSCGIPHNEFWRFSL